MNPNSNKLMTHPTDPSKMIIETSLGNLEVSNQEIRETTLNGVAPELPWDTTVGALISNAKEASEGRLSFQAIQMLEIAFIDKSEDFDGPGGE
jgi:hypothetical protein